MPAERPPSKASENRRATKPIMEKRRRARINQCLSELKTLILDALNKDPSRHSKLEKADILEMTVHHLQNIQRQQMAAAISTDSSVLNKFKAGFNECATEVSRYVGRLEGVDPAMRQRLLSHLSGCLASMGGTAASPFLQPQGGGSFHSLSVQIPLRSSSSLASGDINNNKPLFAVIPSRLPNGDLAFLLPAPSSGGGGGVGAFHLDRSQSSWPPTSPRSLSPMSEDNVVLSPTCSDAGSDVFLEPHHKPQPTTPPPYHHHHHPKERPLFSPGRHVSETEAVWRPW